MPPSNPFWRAMIRRRVRRQYNVLTERGHAAPHYSRRQESAGPLRILGEDVCRDIGHQGHRSEEHTSELQSRLHLVCRLLLEKKKKKKEMKSRSQCTKL